MAEKENKLTVEDLATRVAALESRVTILETAGPAEVRLVPPVIQTTTDHARGELAELKADPSKRMEIIMAGGHSEDAAAGIVAGRIKHLERELGIKPAAKKLAKAAALLAILAFIWSGLTSAATNAMAQDQQGQPQRYVAVTNLPATVTAGGKSNLLNVLPPGPGLGLTNEVIIHRGAGIGLEWFFNVGSGAINMGMDIVPSIDGTNLDTQQNWWLIGPSAGLTNVCITTNWSANFLAGYKALFITQITNLSATPLTNNGALWNVPQGGP